MSTTCSVSVAKTHHPLLPQEKYIYLLIYSVNCVLLYIPTEMLVCVTTPVLFEVRYF